VLRDRVGELRPLFRPRDPCQSTWYRPGELGKFDLWQPNVLIPVGHDQFDKLWVVTGACGFSRLIGGCCVTRHRTPPTITMPVTTSSTRPLPSAT